MKKLLVVAIAVMVILFPKTPSYADDSGYVAYIDSKVIVIEHMLGYVCGELYSYSMMNVGDLVFSKNFNMYGMIKIYDQNTGNVNDVYIDDFWLNKEKANAWIYRHGRPR